MYNENEKNISMIARYGILLIFSFYTTHKKFIQKKSDRRLKSEKKVYSIDVKHRVIATHNTYAERNK